MSWIAVAAVAGATLGPSIMGGGGQQQVSNTQTTRPEAQPYMADLMGQGWALTQQPYTPYPGERTAGFQKLQNQAFTGAGNMQVSPYLAQSGSALQDYMNRAANIQYRPTQYGNQFTSPDAYQAGIFQANQVTPQQLQNYQMFAPQDVSAQTNVADQMSAAQSNYNPQLTNYQMAAPERVAAQQNQAAQMSAAQTDFKPDLQTFQMAGPEKVGTKSFVDEGTADKYMSPYMQKVVGAQQREARRASDIQGQQNAAAAVGKGAFGGSRSALIEAERQRNLATQLGDIEATGQQQAFQNAQQQFNAEQGYGLQASLANQQAGLTAGGQNLSAQLGVQQLGAQTGLQAALANMNSQQQANVQNQAAQLQAMGMNSSQALQAALANQQAGLTAGGQNLSANLGVQQLGTQTGTQMALANLSNQQQSNVQNQAAKLQAMGLNSAQALQAALANQTMGYNVGSQNLAANLGIQQLGAGQNLTAQQLNQAAALQAMGMGESSRQFGYGQGMTAAGLNAQYGQAANQLNEQANQYGAGLGLQGLQTAGGMANTLGNIGNLGYQQQMGIYGLQNQFGGQQQQQQQNILNQQYQDFMNQRYYPQSQLSWFSGLASGSPLSTNTAAYTPAPSTVSQVAGLAGAGAGMYGMYNMANRPYAEGGEVKEGTGAGLAELAISKMA